MTNREFYKKQIEEIKETLMLEGCNTFGVDGLTGNPCLCNRMKCNECSFCVRGCKNSRKEWLEAEHKEPAIDWSKVPVDTKILVRDFQTHEWRKQHFAKYENGIVYSWAFNGTSFTATHCIGWTFAKLYEEDK